MIISVGDIVQVKSLKSLQQIILIENNTIIGKEINGSVWRKSTMFLIGDVVKKWSLLL